MKTKLSYISVPKDQIGSTLRGEPEPKLRSIKSIRDLASVGSKNDAFIAVFDENDITSSDLMRPRVIAMPNANMRDTLAWISTYQSEFSPVSQWCHIVDQQLFSSIDEFESFPEFGGIEAAWAGATIGELIARRGVDLSDISIVWCLSTGTFAYARAASLWPDSISIDEFVELIAEARSLLKAEPRRELTGLSTVWRILTALQSPVSKLKRSLSGAQKAILNGCKDILETGVISLTTAEEFSTYCEISEEIANIDDLNAEDRVRLIDALTPFVDNAVRKRDDDALEAMSFLLGYCVGRVGAGESNLQLLLPFNEKLPIASVWCPCVAALYQPIPWSGALGGLGRLVIRELCAPVRFIDQPHSDISIEELRSKINPSVEFKRLPFRPSSNRVAIVDLLPGVGLAVNLVSEWHGEQRPSTDNRSSNANSNDARTESLIREVSMVLEKYRVKRNTGTHGKGKMVTADRKKKRTYKPSEPKLPLDDK